MTTMLGSLAQSKAVGLLMHGSCHSALHLGGTVLRQFAVAAGAKGGTDLEVVVERLAQLPSPDRMIVTKELFRLQSLAAARTQESLHLATELVAKSNECTAKTEALYRSELMNADALTRAGVFDDRTFLWYLAGDWQETDNSGNPPASSPETWKRLLRKYPGLLDCLRKHVPSWVRPGMSKEEMEDNIANEIENIYKNAKDSSHTFDPKRGLMIRTDEPSRPTAAALACLAKHSGTPYTVVEVMDDDTDKDLDNTPAWAVPRLHVPSRLHGVPGSD